MSDSVRPHRWQPIRLPCPWNSPGKNTGVGCHFLLQCMKVKSESEVAQPCLTPSNPMDCSPPGPSVHGIFQVRVQEWGAIAFSESLVTKTHSMEGLRNSDPVPCGMDAGNEKKEEFKYLARSSVFRAITLFVLSLSLLMMTLWMGG